MRTIRATMLDQMGLPYIFALRSRGISEKRVYLNHAFRNTLNPYITGSANLLAGLFSGSLILEIIALVYYVLTHLDKLNRENKENKCFRTSDSLRANFSERHKSNKGR